jgi:hypothetical protein
MAKSGEVKSDHIGYLMRRVYIKGDLVALSVLGPSS